MTVTQTPTIEYVDADENHIVIKLKNDLRPIILEFKGELDGGGRYYGGLNSVDLTGGVLMNPKTAQLLTNSPDYCVHAVLNEPTLRLGEAVLPAGIKWVNRGDRDNNSPYFHCPINLTRSGDRFLPMELVGDKLVPSTQS